MEEDADEVLHFYGFHFFIDVKFQVLSGKIM